jgi:hypothetical protein
MNRKVVQVLGHEFDCLAAHVTIAGKGTGANLRVAVQRAIANMLADPRLNHRRIDMFKLSAVVIAETTDKTASAKVFLNKSDEPRGPIGGVS